MAIKKTYRGQPFDMEAMVRQHKSTVAAGNMRANANGDILGNGGVVIRKAGEVSRQHFNNTKTVVSDNVSLKTPLEPEKTKKQITPKQPPQAEKKPAKEVELPNGDIIVDDE